MPDSTRIRIIQPAKCASWAGGRRSSCSSTTASTPVLFGSRCPHTNRSCGARILGSAGSGRTYGRRALHTTTNMSPSRPSRSSATRPAASPTGHYARRAPLEFRAITVLFQPTAFSALARGFDSECPCCRRPFADAVEPVDGIYAVAGGSISGVTARKVNRCGKGGSPGRTPPPSFKTGLVSAIHHGSGSAARPPS